MALYVYKFGGTSVGTVEKIQKVAAKIKLARDQGHQIVVVVSAMSGETNRLVALAQHMQLQPNSREMDVLLSTGEQVTIALLSMALEALACQARSYTGGQIKILTDDSHTKARILKIDKERLHSDLLEGKVAVVAGFQGITNEGAITTLGRGGSDTTAVALAAALEADECHIYTDVDGVYTTDPRVEPNAQRLDKITFEEMLEMASLGSKVLQIRAVEFAGKYNVALRVLSSFEPGNGTLITYDEESTMEDPLISGIAFNRDEAKITVAGVPDRPGIASKILSPIADENIEVDMIIQNIALEGNNADFTFTVHRNDYENALDILENMREVLGAKEIKGSNEIVKVSIIGVGMRSHAGVAKKMFTALADENINIELISTSEIKISVLVHEKYLELAVRTLHSTFELDKIKT
ncbi:MAG: aspartate kinase [Methylococcales bacterium]|nr:aspartate kinase [Methylococcales bacterium]